VWAAASRRRKARTPPTSKSQKKFAFWKSASKTHAALENAKTPKVLPNTMTIQREHYLRQLRDFTGTNLIKVLSGIRRCGKSTLLSMFQDELTRTSGVRASQILSLNFEDMANRHLLTADALYEHLQPRVAALKEKPCFIFLDEVQNVADFERVVDSLYVQPGVDLYITGSNAKFLSTDLATLLSGRYVEIHVFPLSFAEFASAFETPTPLPDLYADYLRFGSFPEAVNLGKKNPSLVAPYLQGLYSTVIFKDIAVRHRIQNIARLEDITRYVFDNIGNITNPKRIADFLTSSQRATSNHTVENYLSALSASFVVYTANRYDVKGKRILQTLQKHYAVDPALRNLLSNASPSDYGRILENIVYLELLRRFEKVWIGKNYEKEIDFVARETQGGIHYYQVALSARDDTVLRRELSALQLSDNYPKTLLTLDPEEGTHNGIRRQNALKWLLDENAK
jgi:predicted AAA+ superfamily ATPase